MVMGKIIEFPDEKKLKEKVKELKSNLEDLIFEKNNLQFVICENIKMEYMIIFGSLEYEIYEAYCKYLRLRRKKEMVQAKKNRQESIKIKNIEKELDGEFLEYKKKLDEKIEEINEAINRSKSDFLSDEENILIKKLYKNIVKKLHPDLNPEITDAQQELFYIATESYKDGDIITLQLIFDIVNSEEMEEDVSLSGKSLQDEVKRLEDLVNQIQNDVDLIKSTPPYTWCIYVEDENKKIEKLNELKKELKSFKDAIRTQEEYINDLMRDNI